MAYRELNNEFVAEIVLERYQFWILDFGFWIEEALSVGTLRLTICSPAIIKTVANKQLLI